MFTLVSELNGWLEPDSVEIGNAQHYWDALLFIREGDPNHYVLIRSRPTPTNHDVDEAYSVLYAEIIYPMIETRQSMTFIASYMMAQIYDDRTPISEGTLFVSDAIANDDVWNAARDNPTPHFMEALL